MTTDRHHARKLARHLRSGDLTAVWVPDEAQEALRDPVRAEGPWFTFHTAPAGILGTGPLSPRPDNYRRHRHRHHRVLRVHAGDHDDF